MSAVPKPTGNLRGLRRAPELTSAGVNDRVWFARHFGRAHWLRAPTSAQRSLMRNGPLRRHPDGGGPQLRQWPDLTAVLGRLGAPQ
jgi:hypothetical protein